MICIGCKNENPRKYFSLFFNDLTALTNFFNKRSTTTDDPFITCKECKKICLELLEEKVNELKVSFSYEK